MTDAKSQPKKVRRLKSSPSVTVREQIESKKAGIASKKAKPEAKPSVWRKIGLPFKLISKKLRLAKIFKPFRFMRRVGKFLAKLFGVQYFATSWQELKLVTWPDRKKTRQLTGAVILFALIFGLLIAGVDFGLDKLFKIILTK